MGLTHGVDRRPSMNRAAVPQHDDRAPDRTQERAAEVRHVRGLEVMRLAADIQTHGLALRRYREHGQRREPIMLVVVADDRRVPLRRPGAAARRQEQQAAFIQAGAVSAQVVGFCLWPATGNASTGPWPARCVGQPAARVPGHSSPNGARPSTHARDDRTHQIAPASRRRCASRSTTRWRSHWPWRPAARAAAMPRTAQRSTCVAALVPVWGPRLPRRHLARRVATARLLRPTPVPGAPPRVSSSPAPNDAQRGHLARARSAES
jgi:hypothetical protein